MQIQLVKSKIHRARVTESNIDYIGSITIDEDLMDAAGLYEYELVHVLNYRNGERIMTYTLKGKRGSGIICMNGPSALKFSAGDEVIVIAYAIMEEKEVKNFKPKLIFPDSKTNKLK